MSRRAPEAGFALADRNTSHKRLRIRSQPGLDLMLHGGTQCHQKTRSHDSFALYRLRPEEAPAGEEC